MAVRLTASRRIKQSGAVVAFLAAAAVFAAVKLPYEQTTARTAAAIQDFSAVQRYVFVPSRTTATVTILDRDRDKVAGSLDTGVVPA
jgi:curli biogenesis system outer membrane secretion channel CsgG